MTDLTGRPGNDLLTGTGFGETITGLDGNDIIDASAGHDVVYGGAGDDQVVIALDKGVDEFADGGEGFEDNNSIGIVRINRDGSLIQ